MRGSLLATLRGIDGRSLSRALICLLLLNAVVAGLHSGSVAAGDGMAICSAGHAGGNPGDLAHDENAPCCKAGYLTTVATIADAPPVPEAPAWHFRGRVSAPPRAPLVAAVRAFDHGPRGPPLDA
jgi:hypothetical protein